MLDLDDRIVRWNTGMERLYGLTRDEATGRSLDALFDTAFVDRLRKARQETPAGAELYRVQLPSRQVGNRAAARERRDGAPARTRRRCERYDDYHRKYH